MASFLFRSLAEDLLVFFSTSCDSRKINCLTGEFDSRCPWKNRYHTHPFVIHAIRSVGFSGEINHGIHYLGSEENYIIKILQPVRINKPGAPLLGLAKSIYYAMGNIDVY